MALISAAVAATLALCAPFHDEASGLYGYHDCNGARQRGILMGTEGPHDNVLKMRPPMIFSMRDADHLLDVLEETFAAVTRA